MTFATLRRKLAGTRSQLAGEDGVIAIMTIAFMVFLGMIMIVFLWTIGYSSGAYNTLQGAAQSTAYAAAGAVDLSNDNSQPQYNCTTSDDGYCTSGPVFNVAEQTLVYTLNATQANFGMTYGGSGARLAQVDDAGGVLVNSTSTPGIYVFNVPYPQAISRDVTAAQNPSCNAKQVTTFNDVSGRSCWQIYQQGIGEPQYTSGVAVYLTSTIGLPGCVASWCPRFPISASAAATQAQDLTQSYTRP